MVMAIPTLQRVLEGAKTPPTPDRVAIEGRIAHAHKRIEHIDALRAEMLGIEASAKEMLQKTREEICEEIGKDESRLEHLAVFQRLHQFGRVSLDPLTWRDSKGYPLLAVFDLRNPEFAIEVSHINGVHVHVGGTHRGNADLPIHPNIAKLYGDIVSRFHAEIRDGGGGAVGLRSRFEGVIPREIRSAAACVAKEFGTLTEFHLYLIAEPGEWAMRRIASTPDGDPLLVGYAPKIDPDCFWLIAAFDVTPMEKAMLLANP